jgi:FkbM family methyltransferase
MPLRLVKDYFRRRRLARAGVCRQLDVLVFRAGARSGVWAVCPEGLTADSIVYSFGVGDNVAWDLALIDTFRLTVHAFDPTPACIAWVRGQRLPARFRFHPVGLAGHDGVARFRAPVRPGNCNYVPCPDGEEGVEAPVRRLSSLMAELGHERIDVLKMDVEGGEYDALADFLAAGVRPGQVLVEFHHNLPGIPFAKTLAAIDSLQEAGYRLFDVSRRGLELSFLRGGGESAGLR